MAAKQQFKVLTPATQFFRRLAISEHHGLCLTGHLQNHRVVLGADGISHFKQAVFVRGAIGVDIPDELTAVAPGTREIARPTQGGVAVVRAGDAGIHQQPEDERPGRIPDFPKLVAIFFAIRKYGSNDRVRRPRRPDLAPSIVFWDGATHAVVPRGRLTGAPDSGAG